jgi:hypothetical protein
MDQDYQLTMSPLCRSVSDKGHTVRLEIYRGPDTAWTLEAVDSSNNSTVWDDLFATDQAEPPRESRRLIGVSHAAMASSRVC